MLAKRAKGDTLTEQQEEAGRTMEEEVLLTMKRKWNGAFEKFGLELANSEQARQEREKKYIQDRIYCELADTGVERHRAAIKEITEVK